MRNKKSELVDLWINKVEGVDSPAKRSLFSGCAGVAGSFFFHPAITMNAESIFIPSAAMGLISFPLYAGVNQLSRYLIEHSDFLQQNPNLKSSVKLTCDMLANLSAAVFSALLFGFPPFGVTTMALMVVPVAVTAIGCLINGIAACKDQDVVQPFIAQAR